MAFFTNTSGYAGTKPAIRIMIDKAIRREVQTQTGGQPMPLRGVLGNADKRPPKREDQQRQVPTNRTVAPLRPRGVLTAGG